MKHRTLGPFNVSAIGLGCMNLSHAYGAPVSAEQGERVLLTALDQGVDKVLKSFGGRPHIFNLGHGIVPETPPAHVERLVNRIRRV